MARYMETAAEANEVAKSLMAMIKGPMGQEEYAKAAEMIARLVNLGIRCSPRGVQHTVRLNAVQRAVKDLPVKVSMREVRNEKTGLTFNALVTIPIIKDSFGVQVNLNNEDLATVEGASGEDN